ncbi:MAG: 5'-nucleotidase, lipoprotein e(P4) family [Flavobacteriales bacterium]|nr:5'-nucleotidase, lipoprotein e(P4) family [Flavobacteriales bacterium]
MNRVLIAAIGVSIVACSRQQKLVEATPFPPEPPPAIDHAASLSHYGYDAVLWQHASAEAYRLQQQGYELARLRLTENLKVADKRPPAVIVDIDETVLDNSPYQVDAAADGRIFDQATWKEWTDRSKAAAIPGAVEFLTYAHGLGCHIYYITNRDIREKATTLKNLDSLKFPDADEKHLLLMEGTSDKTERRARVANDNHVVLLVGDQLRDFDERFKDRTVNDGKNTVDLMADTLARYFILLPNPMYGTYRDAVQGKGTDEEKQRNMIDWFQRNRN